MKKMHPKVILAKGNNRMLHAAVACAWALAAATATAQQAAIEACRSESTDAERIACLEAALAAAGDPADDRGDAGQKVERDRDARAGDPAPTEAAGSASGEAPSSPVEAEDEAVSDGDTVIGERQVRARNRTDADLESASGLRVAEYARVPYRRLQITLENGQVWRQIQGDTQRIRADLERNQTVDINETTLGGYQLRLNEMKRTIRVERIR